MKRRAESDHRKTNTQPSDKSQVLDALRMYVSPLPQEQDSMRETQRTSQRDSAFLDQDLDLLRYSPQEIEQRLEPVNQQHQSRHGESPTSCQQEVPSHQAASSASEPVDEAKCHQIVEQLIHPQKGKRIPRLTQEEGEKIRAMLDQKEIEGAIDEQSAKHAKGKLLKKLYDMRLYKTNGDAKRAQVSKRYKTKKEARRTQDAERDKINRETILARDAERDKTKKEARRTQDAKRYKDNRETIRIKDAKRYKDNRETIRIKEAKRYKDNRETIIARNTEYQKRLRIPENRVAFLERTLQKAQDKYDKEIANLQQDIDSLRDQQQKQLLAEKQTRLEQTLHEWNELRERKEKALGNAQRLVEIQQEITALVQHPHSHTHQHDLSFEPLPLRQEPSSDDAAQEMRSFDESYHEWHTTVQASQDAHKLSEFEGLYTEYRDLQRHFEEELEPLLAEFVGFEYAD
jgi:hypothetical protein